MNRKLVNILGSFLGFILFLAALGVLHRALSVYHYHDIADVVRAVPTRYLITALLLMILNYLVMTGYDALAFRYIDRTLEYGKIAFVSFIGYAFSNNIGLSMLAGSSVRYRLYTALGVSILDVARMVVFCTVTLWLGLFSLGGFLFVIEPVALPTSMHLPFLSVRPLGIIFLGLVAGYLIWSFFQRGPLTMAGREIALPSARLSFAQLAVAVIDWVLAGSVLYVLLPSIQGLSLPVFFSVFLLAQVAGLFSQIPGGLGVFESVFITLFPSLLPTPQIIGTLILYRVIYYLLPLVLAASLLGFHEVFRTRTQAAKLVRFMGQGVSAIAPPVLSLFIFAGGALLLFSGATPGAPERLDWIKDIMPLPLLELSHFFGSLVGVALLLLARGIQRRLDSAYHITLLLLGAGSIFSLAKGFDYKEAAFLAIMLVALLPGKRFFYRRASLLSQRFSAGWIAAIAAVLAGSIWLGFFSYRHVGYSNELWWEFTVHGDAPRFLRASVGMIGLAVIIGMMRLLRPDPPEPSLPDRNDLERARSVIALSRDTTGYLALLGDKRFLFSDSGRSFIMYGVEGKSWVAMGDPIGLEEEWKDLVWRFSELCDRHGGWPVFYEAGKENLYWYLDLGLTPLKIGEEARVHLADFSLEGSSRKSLRYVHGRMQREGAVFSLVPARDVPTNLPQLRTISDAWLKEKNTREKRFSLGRFDETYLAEFPLAVVKKEGSIIAFANIWEGADHEELSIDLMRQVPDASRGIMEFLFVSLMLWGREQGFRWFNLGMVPLAGLEDRALAPVWNRLGARVFRHGEHFYNFKGLRQFKERFDPQWEPKYLVTPRGFLLPRVLANLASLISGGFLGVVKK